uniref:Uncharacterized protein n=1 Tax=Timspurckia oligopyrenoides TaxID=708627 RepID=A0A7S1EPD3_9RHOD|mmetsp:Transcript_10434/g.18808  ORF Transcript_10434/g.18808 Transcript_10434/m.18808 type:complete len:234 (+) Transcript_10434:521-1222(+)
MTPELCDAIQSGHLSNVQLLCTLHTVRSKINQFSFIYHSGTQKTPLGLAIEYKNVEIIQVLIQSRADIHSIYVKVIENEHGAQWTALGLAFQKGNQEIIRVLVHSEADVEQFYDTANQHEEWTALALSVQMNRRNFPSNQVHSLRQQQSIQLTFGDDQPTLIVFLQKMTIGSIVSVSQMHIVNVLVILNASKRILIDFIMDSPLPSVICRVRKSIAETLQRMFAPRDVVKDEK